MSVNGPTVLGKVIDALGNLNKDVANSAGMGDEILRSSLKTQIMKGMDEAFEHVKIKGKNLAFVILGIDTTWHEWKFSTNSLLKEELLALLKPRAATLAQSLIDGADIEKFSTLSKTKQAQLMRSMRSDYDEAVHAHVKQHFKKFIDEKAARDVAEVWELMPSILGEGVTFEDVIADHFTDMLAQDADITNDLKNKGLLATRNYMRNVVSKNNVKWIE